MLKKLPLLLLFIIAVMAIPLAAQMITGPGSGGITITDSPLAKQLKGIWSWTSDREEYDGSGNGTYWRGGDVCYKFTYSVNGNIVHTIADRDHLCGAKRENDWRISITGNTMYKEHTGSGYKTEWKHEDSISH